MTETKSQNMKTLETLKTEKVQRIFESTLVIVLLLVLPPLGGHMGKYGGGAAMLVGAVIGLVAYYVLYGKRLCNRGQVKMVVLVVVGSFLVGTAAAIALLI